MSGAARAAIRRWLSGAATLLTCLTAAAGQTGPATVSGQVTILSLDAGQPPSRQGVMVQLVDHATETTRERLTDQDGRFRFDNVPPGRYDMVGRHRGGYGATRLLGLRPGQAAQSDLRLATRAVTWLLTILWTTMAALLGGAFAAAMMLYGPSRDRRDSSAPRSLTIAFLAWLAAFMVFSQLAPDMQPCMLEVADPLSSLLAVGLASCVVLVVVLLQPPWPAACGAVIAGLLLTVAVAASDRTGPWVWAGIGVGLLLWTTAAGWLLALLLKQRSYIVLTAWVVAAIDCFQVFYGTTGQVVSGESAGFEFVRAIGLLPWPLIGSDLLAPRVGYADFLFLAWFLGAALRFELGLVRNYWTMLAAFTIGVVMTQVLSLTIGLAVGLPALPFMSALFLYANRNELALEATEKRQIRRFVGSLVAVLVVLGAIRQGRMGTEREHIVVGGRPAVAEPLQLPWDWAALTQAPLAWTMTVPVAVEAGVRLAQVSYLSETIAGRPVTVRGWLALPATIPAPAVLWLHRSLRTADRDRCLALARQGFVALAIDWNPAAGPQPQSDLAAWPSSEVFEVIPSVDRSVLYHAGVAALRAVYGLTLRPEVQGGVGVGGEAWGGLLAMACGVVAEPVAAVVASQVGWVEQDPGLVGADLARRTGETVRQWLTHYAPERYAARLTKPWLVLGSTNDRYFSLPGVARLQAVSPASVKRLVVEPNADHEAYGERAKMPLAWLAMALRRGPTPLATPELEAAAVEDRLRLRTRGFSQPRAAAATFYVSIGPRGWPGRYWTALPARRDESGWAADCGVAAPAGELGVLVEVVGQDGTRCAQFRSYRTDELNLVLQPPPWPSPEIGWPPGPERVWRRQDEPRRELLAVQVDGDWQLRYDTGPDGPDEVVLETNAIDALRRLGAQADSLVVTLEVTRPGPVTLVLVEAAGGADERRCQVSVTPAGLGRRRLVFPLHRLQGHGPHRVEDWSLVDALQLRFAAEAPTGAAVWQVVLSGPPSSGVRPLPDGRRP